MCARFGRGGEMGLKCRGGEREWRGCGQGACGVRGGARKGGIVGKGSTLSHGHVGTSSHSHISTLSHRRGKRGKSRGGESGFRFDLNARLERSRYSERELLASLREFARLVGWRRFTAREFHAWRGPRPGVNTVLKRFGSWRAALRKIGIRGVRAREYSAAELVERLELVWRKMGRAPGAAELVERGGLSITAYKRRWGSVRRACALVAGYHAGRVTRGELLRGEGAGPRRKGMAVDVRWKVLKRDRYRCSACGKSPATDARVELEVDHIVPVARGGGNEEGNLRTLCGACNVGKGDESTFSHEHISTLPHRNSGREGGVGAQEKAADRRRDWRPAASLRIGL